MMRRYEYKCRVCDIIFEVKANVDNIPETAPCPQCEGKCTRKFTAVGVVYKSNGFYITDSKPTGGI